ncbi:hypothetical protein RZS08_13960, partial [Arthrospira platensis SPKY1]|nr:hypothetical protein [Arthrospira platensis SPKY1]
AETPTHVLDTEPLGIQAEASKQPESSFEILAQQSPDPVERRVYELFVEMQQNQQNQISLKDFDHMVFNGSVDPTQVSRLRSKLFDVLRERHGKNLIQLDRNPLDKRYKILVVNFS